MGPGGIIAVIAIAYLGGAMLTGYIAARLGDFHPPSVALGWPVVAIFYLPMLAVKWAIRKGERR